MKVKFLKIMLCPYKNESRSKREIAIVKDLANVDVGVLEYGANDGFNIEGDITFYTKQGSFTGGVLNRLSSFIKWAGYVKNINADVISCYDISALTIAWVASCFYKKKKPKLVYDSHEFEIGRNTSRSKIVSFVIKYMERFLMKRCVFSIMVNDTIADNVKEIHKLKERPLVIHSVQDYVEIDESIIKKQREIYNKQYHIEKNDFLVMYHGAIMSGRGIENILKALVDTHGIKFIILGFGEDGYIQDLKDLILALKLESKVFFHSAVHHTELWKFVGAVDAGIVMIDNICLSYYYSLPNKFFQNIQAHTPIIGSDFPEIKSLIEKYKIGLTCKSGNPDHLRKAIINLKNDKESYKSYKNNLVLASKELCWENEKIKLEAAYKEIL